MRHTPPSRSRRMTAMAETVPTPRTNWAWIPTGSHSRIRNASPVRAQIDVAKDFIVRSSIRS